MPDRGSSLSQFADFWNATRQVALSDPNTLASQALRYRTFLAPIMLKGLTEKKMIRAGSEITDFLQLSYTNRFQLRNFGDSYSFTDSNSLVQMTAPWRVATVDTVVHEHEIDLQQGGRDVVFKKVMAAKEAEAEASWWESMEELLWGSPDNSTMESSTFTPGTTLRPYSLRVFLPDDGASLPSGFTTVHGVNPSTYPNWAPQSATFTNTSATTRSQTVIRGLDKLFLKCDWQVPDGFKQWSEDLNKNKLRILCNQPSSLFLKDEARERNNVLTPRGDLGWVNDGSVTFHGIPIQYNARLDTIDTDATTAVGAEPTADDGASKLGYKWRLIDFAQIHPVFHPKHYRRQQEKDDGARNPYAKVFIEDTWFNFICMNRRTSGVLKAA